MTTLTTLLAMVPMALGLGEGSEQQVPLAITIIFGLTTSSVFTLLFVPVMYTILDDISSWIKRKVFRRSVPVPASETGRMPDNRRNDPWAVCSPCFLGGIFVRAFRGYLWPAALNLPPVNIR